MRVIAEQVLLLGAVEALIGGELTKLGEDAVCVSVAGPRPEEEMGRFVGGAEHRPRRLKMPWFDHGAAVQQRVDQRETQQVGFGTSGDRAEEPVGGLQIDDGVKRFP